MNRCTTLFQTPAGRRLTGSGAWVKLRTLISSNTHFLAVFLNHRINVVSLVIMINSVANTHPLLVYFLPDTYTTRIMSFPYGLHLLPFLCVLSVGNRGISSSRLQVLYVPILTIAMFVKSCIRYASKGFHREVPATYLSRINTHFPLYIAYQKHLTSALSLTTMHSLCIHWAFLVRGDAPAPINFMQIYFITLLSYELSAGNVVMRFN